MDAISELPTQNLLLAALSEEELEHLLPQLRRIDLKIRDTLYRPNTPMNYAHFPLSGICSIIGETSTGVKSEVGIVGREGFLGSSIVLFTENSPFEVVVQIEGEALRMEKAKLHEAMGQNLLFRAALLRFTHVFSVQTVQTAVANAYYSPAERLARWLLMCQDRVNDDTFTMTHEFLSVMLAVPVSGVPAILIELKSISAISFANGKITVLDRGALKSLAGGTYGIPEKEYELVMKAEVQRGSVANGVLTH